MKAYTLKLEDKYIGVYFDISISYYGNNERNFEYFLELSNNIEFVEVSYNKIHRLQQLEDYNHHSWVGISEEIGNINNWKNKLEVVEIDIKEVV